MANKKTTKVPETKALQHRSFPIELTDALGGEPGQDTNGDEIVLSASSDKPYLRAFGYEVLSHDPKAVDLSRMQTKAPVLVDHAGDQVGVVDRAWLEGGKMRAAIRFSKSARGREIEQDIRDGIRANVSIGYEVTQWDDPKVRSQLDGQPVFTATKWQPAEISIVSVPADTSVGVGRSRDGVKSSKKKALPPADSATMPSPQMMGSPDDEDDTYATVATTDAGGADASEVSEDAEYSVDGTIRSLTHNSVVAKDEPTWSSVDKSSLPRQAFAGQGEPDKKSTWSYPHHWVKGATKQDASGVDTNGDMYLHTGGLKAAWAAANGAHSGKKASPAVIAHLAAHRKDLGLDKEGKSHLATLKENRIRTCAEIEAQLKHLVRSANDTSDDEQENQTELEILEQVQNLLDSASDLIETTMDSLITDTDDTDSENDSNDTDSDTTDVNGTDQDDSANNVKSEVRDEIDEDYDANDDDEEQDDDSESVDADNNSTVTQDDVDKELANDIVTNSIDAESEEWPSSATLNKTPKTAKSHITVSGRTEMKDNAKDVVNPNIKLNAKEQREYSLSRAIYDLASGKRSGLAFEISQDIANRTGRETTGLWIPTSMQTRAIDIGGTNSGDELTFVSPGEFVDFLRNRAVVAQMGASVMTLPHKMALPRATSDNTATWVTEDGTGATAASQSYDQVVLSPKKLVAQTAYSLETLRVANFDIEQLTRTNMYNAFATAFDKAALVGAGGSQPTGLLNLTGLVSGSGSGSALTYAGALEVWQKVAEANADFGSLAFLTTPKIYSEAASTIRSGSTAQFIINDDKQIMTYPVYTSNNLTQGTFVFGNWESLIMAEFGALEVIVDPYTSAGSGIVKLTAAMLADIEFKWSKAFAVQNNLV